jgi:hypothetical protein
MPEMNSNLEGGTPPLPSRSFWPHHRPWIHLHSIQTAPFLFILNLRLSIHASIAERRHPSCQQPFAPLVPQQLQTEHSQSNNQRTQHLHSSRHISERALRASPSHNQNYPAASWYRNSLCATVKAVFVYLTKFGQIYEFKSRVFMIPARYSAGNTFDSLPRAPADVLT